MALKPYSITVVANRFVWVRNAMPIERERLTGLRK